MFWFLGKNKTKYFKLSSAVVSVSYWVIWPFKKTFFLRITLKNSSAFFRWANLVRWVRENTCYFISLLLTCNINSNSQYNDKWTAPCENVSSRICGQRRPRSAWASAPSEQGIHFSLTESLTNHRVHYENTPIQIYRKCHLKTEQFQIKKNLIFFIFLLKT